MNQPIDIGALLKLRKLTRSVSDELRSSLQGHLATLSPLLLSRQVLGRHADGNAQHAVRGEDEAFAQVVTLYQQLIRTPEFSLPADIDSPLGIRQASLEICPADYSYNATDEGQTKRLTIISPTRWVIYPSGCSPNELRELIGQNSTSASELKRFALQYIALQVLLSTRTEIGELFAGLRFPIVHEKLDGCGELPICIAESPITTVRAGDGVIIQSTELTGTDTFEEVIDQAGVENIVDPVRSRVKSLMDQS